MNFNALTEYLKTLEGELGLAGYDCAVYLDGGEVYRRMDGYADREAGRPIAHDTIYRMFSMTKPITCTAALQLYEKGRFLLTDPLGNYLPEFREMTVREGDSLRPARNPITIRNLFTMSAGLTYDLDSPSMQALKRDTDGRYTTRQLVQALAKEPLTYDPGERWVYSLAHDVLGALIEEVSGLPFEEYLQRHIFAPLGMKDAHFFVPEDKLGRVAYRYGCERGKAPVREAYENLYQASPNYRSGGAGLSCTLDDYARFACALCRGGWCEQTHARILGSATVRLMRENQLSEAQMRDFNWVQYAGYGYGLGVRTLVSRAESGSPGGLGEFGWGGAAGTYALIDPEYRLVMLFGQQSTPNFEHVIQPRIRNILYRCLEEV